MKEIILLKSGELMLKGLNRRMFENQLVKNAKYALEPYGEFEITRGQATFMVRPLSEHADMDGAVDALSKVFGFSALARSAVVDKDFDEIQKVAVDYVKDALLGVRTFKVEARRSDKKFPLNSPEISQKLGGVLLEAYPHLKVDLHNPEIEVMVEIRERGAYIHTNQLKGAGGMPVASAGKGTLLISGGIDSPVAGYMMAKRGIQLVGVHFESPPYTSARALHKVEILCEKVSAYSGPIKLYTVPFTKAQEEMKNLCPDSYITLIMRRFMMQIAERIGENENCGALITGESVGQVASQTMTALASTDSVVRWMPVLRPLVGMDKNEIIKTARKIDTYETSILPYEDCCTVFTPRRPKTNAKISQVEAAEKDLDIEGIIKTAVEDATWKIIKPY